MFYVSKIAEILGVNNSIAADVYTRLSLAGVNFSEMPQEQFEREVRQQYWAINTSPSFMLMNIK